MNFFRWLSSLQLDKILAKLDVLLSIVKEFKSFKVSEDELKNLRIQLAGARKRLLHSIGVNSFPS